MKLRIAIFAAAAASVLAGAALAHHSFAMFDPEHTITKQGVVKELEWTNPHVWLHMMMADEKGKPVEWSFEMQAVQQAITGGWRPDIVKPGDRVTVDFHPFKDGSRGGELITATLPNGTRLLAQKAHLPVPKAP
jgi:Family of unknown function (DUF6152)